MPPISFLQKTAVGRQEQPVHLTVTCHFTLAVTEALGNQSRLDGRANGRQAGPHFTNNNISKNADEEPTVYSVG